VLVSTVVGQPSRSLVQDGRVAAGRIRATVVPRPCSTMVAGAAGTLAVRTKSNDPGSYGADGQYIWGKPSEMVAVATVSGPQRKSDTC
jgi:hypothetical protein